MTFGRNLARIVENPPRGQMGEEIDPRGSRLDIVDVRSRIRPDPAMNARSIGTATKKGRKGFPSGLVMSIA